MRTRRRDPVAAMLAVAVTALTLSLSGPPAPALAAGPCEPPLQVVACENTRPGSPRSEWDVAGSGSTTIQGFATSMSVDNGETVRFKVSTPATAYRLDVYRLGYYGGLGARKVGSVLPSTPLPQTQPSCLVDTATRLVDCGNWAESASWAVPADAASGVYLAKLIRTDGTAGSSHVVFVVRDDDRRSDVLLQTSDATWQAYNRYGGYSLYAGSPTRAYKVSYNRPFSTRGCCSETFLFDSEYPMLRWLEANGYDVSYTSGVDTELRGAELLEHRAFLSSGHDEYWSAGQRANVTAARDAGVNLAFFSGNEMYWKTRWEPSADGQATPARTLVSYKETLSSRKIDPDPAWTGTWRDSRFSPPSDGGRPENALTGTLFTVNCCSAGDRQDYGIQVPQQDGRLRLWRGTDIASQPPGGIATLPAGTLGYEWDEDVDNGVRPPGLFRMSTTTHDVGNRLLDQGNTFAPGTATHSLTSYRAPSGARVFGAGTIRWAWGLDPVHDGPASQPDPRLQQATVNLLADFGAQPSTLSGTLRQATATSDTTPPTSALASPAAGVTLTADQPITVSGTASDTGGVVAAVEVSTDGGVTWHPATGRDTWTYTWTPSSPGAVTLKTRAVDDSGNLETPGSGRTVTVLRACPCQIWNPPPVPRSTSTDTAPHELGVKFRAQVDGVITGVRFHKSAGNTGTHLGRLWSSTGVQLASATFSGETASGWQQVQFAAPVPVTAGTTYVASYYAPSGQFSYNTSSLVSAVTSPPLVALANGTDGTNGVYRYGSAGFPKSSYSSTNYWVDVVFSAAPLAAPTGVTATATSPTAVDVRWSDGTGETAYRVERSGDGGGSWTSVGSVGQDVVLLQDAGLVPSTTYSYRVVALGYGAESPPSSTSQVRTPSAPPPTPTGVVAQAVSSTSIEVSWTAVGQQTGYRVERSADGTTGWTSRGTVDDDTTLFADTGLAPSTTYHYRVVAVNADAQSAPSAVTSATTHPSVNAPAAPGSLTATALSSTSVELGWRDVAGETSYEVQRSQDGTTWAPVGSTAQDVTTFLDADDLAAATTYSYRVVARNAGGDSAPSGVAVVTTRREAPAPPADITAVAVGSDRIDITWSDTSGETGYTVETSGDGLTGWTVLTTTAADVTTASHAGLAAGSTHWYRVLATSSDGASPPSEVASATTTGNQAPAAPTGVSATAASSSQIDVGWSSSPGADAYQVWRSPDGTSGWTPRASTGATTTRYADTGLAPGTTHYYRVTASAGSTTSAPSGTASATTLPLPPPTPDGLTATAVSGARVDLSWHDVSGETGYRVERSTGSSGWTVAGTTSADVVTFTDQALAPGTTVAYRVVAVNAGGESPPTTTVGLTTPSAPAAPTSLSATALSPSSIRLAWSDVQGETGYRLERSPDGSSDWLSVGTTSADVLGYDDTGRQAATTYWYRVVAVNAEGDSAASPTASATTQPAPAAPATPTGVSATTASTTEVDVRWTDVVGETGYRVEASSDGTTGWAGVATTAEDVTSARVSGLVPGTTYWFRVVAVNAVGASVPSASARATTTPLPPPTPTGVSAVAVSSSGIDVSWTDVTGEDGYRLERTSGSEPWSTVATLPAGTTQHQDRGLTAATSYAYRAVAVGPGGDSAPSEVASATTAPAGTAPSAPTGLVATATSTSTVELGWSDVSTETSYRVERSADGVTGWLPLATTPAGTTSYTDTGLQPASTWWYRVVAVNGSGDSPPSAVVSVTTQASPTAPPTPTGVTATAVSSTQVEVTWVDVPGETQYRVERSSDGVTGWTALGTTAADVATFTDLNASPGRTSWYRVVAVNAVGSSAPSASAAATTPADTTAPTAPATLTATGAKKKVTLSWSASTDSGGSGLALYEVWRSQSATGDFSRVASVTGKTTYNDVSLPSRVTYWYYVVAVDGAGNRSAPSGTESATTS